MTQPSILQPTRRGLILGGAALTAACSTLPAGYRPAAIPDAVLLPRAQAVLDRHVAEARIPGATVGVRRGPTRPLYLQSGTLDHNAGPPMDRDSLFRIYSMTKPITGAAAALLIEDGRLTLDTPVADLLPEFARVQVAVDPKRSLDARPAQSVMTVRHLLTHTAGLSYHFISEGPVESAYRRAGVFPVTGFNLAPAAIDGPKVHDLDEMVRRLGEIPLLFEPGSAMMYSVSLDVLGLVIQRASGMAFPDFVQRRLFDPIGMNDTVWRLRPGDAARFASVYDYSEPARALVDGPSGSPYADPVTLFAGGAGLVSSTRDYLAFMSTILNDGRAGRVPVMRPETALLIRSDILPPGVDADGGGYGFGGSVTRAADPKPGGSRAGEFGWGGAAGTQAWIDPAADLAAVIMVQFFPYGAVQIVPEVRAALAEDLALL